MGSTFLCYIPGEPHINMAGLGIIDTSSISIPGIDNWNRRSNMFIKLKYNGVNCLLGCAAKPPTRNF